MRISLNLATRPYADLGPAMHRLRIGMGVLVAVCLGVLLGLHEVHNKAEAARAREHALDGQIAHINGERQGYMRMMQQPDNASLLRQSAMLNQVFDQKAFSWTLAMENLETVLPGGVQVTTLEPVRTKGGQITLQLRVVGPRDLAVNLVRNLEHSQRFLSPRIVGENAEAEGNGVNRPLEPVSASNRFDFEILAEYNPPTPEERKAAKVENSEVTGGEAAPSGNAAAGEHRASRFPANAPGTNAPAPERKPNPATRSSIGAPTQKSGGPR